MTIEEAKSIRIADYLHSLGYSPVKQQGINLWYKSPFREESEASFKVNTEREQWYDFGLGKGGNIIALAAHLYATDHVPYILKRIAEQTPHVRPISFSFGKQSSSEPSFQHLEIVPLSSPALLAYLQGRGINTELAKRECSEARFTHNGKRYFAIAFPNGSGGFEVRIHFFDGGIQEILACREEGGDGLLRACRKLVGVSGGRRDVEVVVAEAVVFHDDVFVHSKGGKHKCRYDACAPFARRAMDNDGIIVLVQQNIENPAVFFGVVADELAVHLLHDSVDSVALDFLFLHTFQDILHVAGRNGDMDHFEFLLQRALSVRFDR